MLLHSQSIRYHYPRIGQSQKKMVLYDNAMKLIDTLDFLNDDNRVEVKFHKKHLKEPLTPDLAWRRLHNISVRLNETILPKAKELIEIGYNKSHEEFCELLLQSILVSWLMTYETYPLSLVKLLYSIKITPFFNPRPFSRKKMLIRDRPSSPISTMHSSYIESIFVA